MKKISRAKSILLRIEQLGLMGKLPNKLNIRRANKKLKEVSDITGVNIQIEEDSSDK